MIKESNTQDNNIDEKQKRYWMYIGVAIVIIGICTIILLGKMKDYMGDPFWTITQYASVTDMQSMFYTIEDKAGRLIIIDGGWDADADQVKSVIEAHNNHVYAWIITHPHPDHAGAFNIIMNDPGDIVVDDIYCPTVDIDRYRETAHDWDVFPVCEEFFRIKEGLDNVHYVGENDEWDMLGLHVKVLHGWDEKVNHLSANLCNKGSIMFQVYGREDNMLFCADTEAEVEKQIIDTHKDELAADYLQAGHHGNWGLTTDFYQYVNPKIVFFDSTDALLEPGELGYDAGDLKKYFEEQGAEVHNFSTAPNVIVLR